MSSNKNKKSATPWISKIVGYAEVDTESILANNANWRTHPKKQQDVLLGLLSDVGVVQNIVINQRTSDLWPASDRNIEVLLDGHARVMLALRHDQPTLPATFVDLTPREEALVLALLDPSAALARADTEKLASLLQETSTGYQALQQFLGTLAQDAGIVPPDADLGLGAEAGSGTRHQKQVTCPSCGECFTP